MTRAKFHEGTKLWVFVDEPPRDVEVDDEDVAAIRRARASIRAGRKLAMDQLLKLLPRPSRRIARGLVRPGGRR